MQNNMDSDFVSKIQNVLTCCKNIQRLLSNDKEYFSQHQLSRVDESNQKKLELLDRLNILTTELNSGSQAIAMWSKLKEDHQDLLQELKTEIMACYQYLTINSGIVFANLSQLKDIWDKLAACKPKEAVYDHKGVVR